MTHAVFWTAAAGMEISWVYALSAFILHAVAGRPYPLPEAVALFVLAAAQTAYTRERGWRIIQILLFHGAGLTGFVFRSVHALWYPSEAFWSLAWLGDFFNRTQTPSAWFTLAVFVANAAVFWFCGVRTTRRPTTYSEICTRFDKGLTWFFALLFVKLFIRTQMGIQSTDPISEALIFPFFVFGLLAVALARNRSGAQKDFMSGYRGLGLMISFSTAVLLCGSGLVLLFLPYLRAASEYGYTALIISGKFLGPILVKILMAIFGYKSQQPATAVIPSRKDPLENLTEGEPTPWMELFLKICGWVFGVLLGLLAVFLIGVAAWYLWRWLFSRTRKTERSAMNRSRLIRWLERWAAYLQRVYAKLLGRKKGSETVRLYRALLKWGERSGFPNRIGETPLEYGRRLKLQFNMVSPEIDRIISVFNQHVYGGVVCAGPEAIQVRQALKSMQRPGLWPKRFKSWFLNSA